MRKLTEEGEALNLQFQSFERERNNKCTCFISPPCSWCTHEGNPLNLENSDEYWVEEGDEPYKYEGSFEVDAKVYPLTFKDGISNQVTLEDTPPGSAAWFVDEYVHIIQGEEQMTEQADASNYIHPRYQDMTVLHSTTTPGDCFRACIATIIGRKTEDIPHFALLGDNLAMEVAIAWLYSIGYRVDKDANAYAEEGIEPMPWCMLKGYSERGIYHAVVGDSKTLEFLHDPHPSRAGIKEVTNKLFLFYTKPFELELLPFDMVYQHCVEDETGTTVWVDITHQAYDRYKEVGLAKVRRLYKQK